MFIPTPGKSPVKTADKGSDDGLSWLLGVGERMEGVVIIASLDALDYSPMGRSLALENIAYR